MAAVTFVGGTEGIETGKNAAVKKKHFYPLIRAKVSSVFRKANKRRGPASATAIAMMPGHNGGIDCRQTTTVTIWRRR